MKKLLVALSCTLGAVACSGDRKPAEAPSTPATGDITETTTTAAPSTTQTTPSTSPMTPAPAPEPNMMPSPSGTDLGGTAGSTMDQGRSTVEQGRSTMDQGMGAMDEGKDSAITVAVRSAVAADTSVSTDAKNNIKIETAGGKVTLKGNVRSDAEKSTIETKAKSVAGVSDVDNQLEVKKKK